MGSTCGYGGDKPLEQEELAQSGLKGESPSEKEPLEDADRGEEEEGVYHT